MTTPDRLLAADMRAGITAYAASDRQRADRLTQIEAMLGPADREAERSDIAFLVAELGRAAGRETVLLHLLDVCGVDDDELGEVHQSPPRLGPVAPLIATGAAGILGALTVAGALIGRIRVAVGRSRRG
ncbi:MAG: hypothetical protein ACREXX_13950 [Gammaproteobacteria bacterium]